MAMIGRYLSTLTPEQEGRVLTQTFEPVCSETRRALGIIPNYAIDGCRCLVMTVEHRDWWRADTELAGDAGMDYEAACGRFGVERVNAAVRARVLRNQLRRELERQRETVTA
jgi:hypothetical protein